MSYINFKNRYNKYPETIVEGFDDEAFNGWQDIKNKLKDKMNDYQILIVDCYPGVNDSEIFNNLKEIDNFDLIIDSNDIFYDGDKLTELMQPYLTNDRVRGIYYHGTIDYFIDKDKYNKYLSQVNDYISLNKKILIYGFCASKLTNKGLLVYADMNRWQIQLRYRKGMPNYKQENYDEDPLRKIKRGYFIEWRIADKHKEELYERIDYYLDTTTENNPNMVCGDGLRKGLHLLTKIPFRTVPYFDPGVWGGQWMKEVCDLDKNEINYAWAFDGVPEENSIIFRFNKVKVESPAMNLTKYLPIEFLGEKTYKKFGAEFPIRFDFLDTMDGQNLSLQVHPTLEYIKKKFAMEYTQDESYFILDCQNDGGVYLGLKENIDSKEMIKELKLAQSGKIKFDANKYINFFKANKFDHYSIPAGTIHCSSKDCMVLEISATPYNFTFKLWDWDRLGLDGLPRPIHIEDGEKVIQYDRTTSWVKDNLVNKYEFLYIDNNYSEIKTGLHELEFIETRLYKIKKSFILKNDGEFCMCNLVDGEKATIKSLNNEFEDYKLHYAETFIIPANCKEVIIKTVNNKPIKIIKANVRF